MSAQPPIIWKKVTEELPPEGDPVRTVTENGLEQTLVRRGRLWWFVDGSMYVYYVPQLWRELTESEKTL